MATQPTNPIIKIAESDVNLPSTGQPNKNEPSAAIKTTGYDKDQVVTAEELNYIFDNFSEWLDYLVLEGDDTSTRIDSLEQIEITGGNGLSDGGDLSQNRSISMGTPSSLDGSTSNSVTTSSHTHELNMASQAEAEAGTDSNKLMSPETVHQAVPFTFAPSIVNGSSHTSVLPNGLILKWGTGTSTVDAPEVFTFTSPFPNACFVINTQPIQSSTLGLSVSARDANGFTIDRAETIGGSVPFDYFAIGY